MTLGEKLLDLTLEYRDAKAAGDWPQHGGVAVHREPAVIAAEYEEAVRTLLTKP